MNSSMLNLAVCASLVLVAGDVSAQPLNYWVEARAITGGMPGYGASYVGPLQGEASAKAEHDPPALQWIYNLKHQLFSDAEAYAWTDIGSLAVRVQAVAQRIQATSFPASVTANSYTRFSDRFLVTSDTLPRNTPVTLTFQAAVQIDHQSSGLFDGKVGCNVQVGGGSVFAQWTVAHDKPASVVSSPTFVVKTAVGATLSISGRLDTLVRASFAIPGPQYDGSIELDASCDTPLIASSGDVRLVTESGVDYAAL